MASGQYPALPDEGFRKKGKDQAVYGTWERVRSSICRPGHETYSVFNDNDVMKIIENAALWMGAEVQGLEK